MAISSTLQAYAPTHKSKFLSLAPRFSVSCWIYRNRAATFFAIVPAGLYALMQLKMAFGRAPALAVAALVLTAFATALLRGVPRKPALMLSPCWKGTGAQAQLHMNQPEDRRTAMLRAQQDVLDIVKLLEGHGVTSLMLDSPLLGHENSRAKRTADFNRLFKQQGIDWVASNRGARPSMLETATWWLVYRMWPKVRRQEPVAAWDSFARSECRQVLWGQIVLEKRQPKNRSQQTAR